MIKLANARKGSFVMARCELTTKVEPSGQSIDFFGIPISLEYAKSPEEDERFWQELKQTIRHGGGIAIWLDSRDTEDLHYSVVTGWPANLNDLTERSSPLTCIIPLPLFALEIGYLKESLMGDKIGFNILSEIVEKIQESAHGRIWLGDGDMWRRLHGLRYNREIIEGESDKILLSSAVLATETALKLWPKIAQTQAEFDYGWVGRELKTLPGKVILADHEIREDEVIKGVLTMVVYGGIKGRSVCVDGPNGWVIYESDEALAEKIANKSRTPFLKHKGRWLLPQP
jgi:hypothetical protein